MKKDTETLPEARLAELSGHPMVLLEPEGKCLYANAAARNLGVETGGAFWNLVVESHLPSLKAEIGKVLGSARVGSFDLGLVTSEGRRDYRVALVDDQQGELCLTMADVSDLQGDLGRLREQYLGIFHSTTDALIIMSLDGHLVDVNRAACDMHGYTREEFLQLAPADFIHPESIPEFLAYAESVKRGEPYYCEARDLRRDGSAFDIEVHGFPFLYHGQPHMLGVITETTQRKKAEREWRRSEQRKAEMIQAAPDGILVLDARGLIRESNPAARDLFGFDEESGRELFIWDLIAPNDFALRVQKALRGGETGQELFQGRHECSARTSSGGLRALELSLTPLDGSGQPEFLVFLRDIEERQRLAAQLQQSQKMEVVGQLTGGIAHDFNNLLTALVGNLALIEEVADDPDRVRALAARAAGAAGRAGDLTHRLLAFSRKQPLRPCSVRVDLLVKGMEELLKRTLGETIEIETDWGEDLWDCEVDPHQLENAVLNLAINARDAMPEGGTLTLRASNVEVQEEEAETFDFQAGSYVVFSVTDDGEGIPEEALPQVFDPFFSTKDVGQGSGLGLSMVYGFIKQSKGHVRLFSKLGKGTSVQLYLPRSERPAQQPSTKRKQAPVPSGRGEVILVVEDDHSVRFVTVSLLKSLGYSSVEAEDALTALRKLKEHPEIAMVLADVVLPGGMSGKQLADVIKEESPGKAIVFTSGYSANKLTQSGRLESGVRLLQKPFSKKQLALAVRKALDAPKR